MTVCSDMPARHRYNHDPDITMISPEDIRQQALKWWRPLLKSYIQGQYDIASQPFFPKEVARIGKVRSGDVRHRFGDIQSAIAILNQYSKNETGVGYLVKTAESNFRHTGTHELPDSIVIETVDDYLHITGKKKEFRLFVENFDLLTHSQLPLQSWIVDNPTWLTQPDIDWSGIIQVCRYFMARPRPGLYIRQLPVLVHTKFIEDNDTLLQSLLDFLIPDHVRNKDRNKFAERYFLLDDEPLIRIRLLDEKLCIHNQIMDWSIRLSDFERTEWNGDKVLMTENKMNFLTLPYVPGAIAIWSGGGFKVSHLQNAPWLKRQNIYYWGDIDEHGFQILHQLRSYYRQTRSIMMDMATFRRFETFAVPGKRNKSENLNFLTDEEARLYRFLKSRPTNNRLEQEKIPQEYADSIFAELALH